MCSRHQHWEMDLFSNPVCQCPSVGLWLPSCVQTQDFAHVMLGGPWSHNYNVLSLYGAEQRVLTHVRMKPRRLSLTTCVVQLCFVSSCIGTQGAKQVTHVLGPGSRAVIGCRLCVEGATGLWGLWGWSTKVGAAIQGFPLPSSLVMGSHQAQSKPLGAALLHFVGSLLQAGLGRESQDPGTLKPYTCLVQSPPVHTASAPPITLPRLQPRSC